MIKSTESKNSHYYISKVYSPNKKCHKLKDLLDNSNSVNNVELIIGPNDTLTKYSIRYIKRPKAIILSALDGVTLDGISTAQNCELDPILHQEILQRAVELAKAAYTGDLSSSLALG